MNITFVYRGFESLGIESLSAVLKQAGYGVDLVYDPALFDTMFVTQKAISQFVSYYPVTLQRLKEKKSEIFAFSVFSDDYSWASRMAKDLKQVKPESIIVFGGIHPSTLPEKVVQEEFIDYVCVGEGEGPFLDLIKAIDHKEDVKKIPNIWSKRGGEVFSNHPRQLVEDLDALPFPDKDLFHEEYYGFSTHYYNIVSTRGCPFDCTFCYPSYFRELYKNKGKFLRRRSVDNVIEELIKAKEKYNMKMVNILDDVFTFDKEWLRDFARKYHKYVNIPNFCFIHPMCVDKEIVGSLKTMNTVAVNMGIQVADEGLRKQLLNRQESNEAIKKTMRLISETNIFLYVDLLLGVPGQDKGELINTANLLSEHRPDAVTMCWLNYYPKTKISEIVKNSNWAKQKSQDLDEETQKLGFLILISNLLPKRILRLMIDKRLYKLLPQLSPKSYRTYTVNFAFACFISFWKEVFRLKKTTALYALRKVLSYYIFFTKKILNLNRVSHDK